METSQPNDFQSIACLKRGDLTGLDALVERYQLRAIRTACLIIGDRSLAEDIVQNAFFRLGERIHQFDPSRPFGPWFLRCVVNDAIKSAKRQQRHVSLDDDEDTLDWLTDPALLPEAVVEAEETRRAVWQALQKLSPQQRATIVMRYYLDMDEASMSRELNSPAGTVKWRLHAARQRLRQLLVKRSL